MTLRAVPARTDSSSSSQAGDARESSVAVSVLVPVFNEALNIPELHVQLSQALADVDAEFLFIDDGSTDDTFERLLSLVREDPRVRVLRLRRNYGQTAALSAGIDHAHGRVIVPMDGDLQNDPADIPRLLAMLEDGYDVVSGWRRHRRDSFHRRFTSQLANRIVSAISGVRLHDFGCSLKAYRRTALEDVRLYGEMHRFVPIYARWEGARVTELEVQHHPRRHGQSKYGIDRSLKVVLDMIVVKFLASYATKPIYVFGGFGLLAFVLSLIGFALMLYYKYLAASPKTFIETPLPTLVVTFGLAGCLSVLLGLVAELSVRTYYESQGKRTYVIASLHGPISTNEREH